MFYVNFSINFEYFDKLTWKVLCQHQGRWSDKDKVSFPRFVFITRSNVEAVLYMASKQEQCISNINNSLLKSISLPQQH